MSAPVSAAPSTTPTLRATGRRWLFWVVVAIVVIAAAIISLAAVGSSSDAARLDPRSPAPSGSKAVVEVLRSQGVEVTIVETSAAALEALGGTGTTLVIHDPSSLLTEERLEALAGRAAVTVLLEPGFLELDAIAPGIEAAGLADGTATAGCAWPIADRADEIVGDDSTYRIGDAADGAIGCFRGEDGDGDRFRLVAIDGDGDAAGDVVVVGATTALTNEAATTAGNGALALGVLGQQPRLVWLTPTLAELAGTAPPTIGDLSPGWVVPFAVLAVLVAIAAAVVTGRRMGPLMIEPLPVVVPSSETMRGRARLYAASRARLRAADALRLGTVGRLARHSGLASSAGLDEVCAAVAAITGTPVAGVRDLLVDRIPATDRELVDLSDALLRLERDLQDRARP